MPIATQTFGDHALFDSDRACGERATLFGNPFVFTDATVKTQEAGLRSELKTQEAALRSVHDRYIPHSLAEARASRADTNLLVPHTLPAGHSKLVREVLVEGVVRWNDTTTGRVPTLRVTLKRTDGIEEITYAKLGERVRLKRPFTLRSPECITLVAEAPAGATFDRVRALLIGPYTVPTG